MLFQPNWWSYIGDVNEATVIQEDQDKDADDEINEAGWDFLGDVQEIEIEMQAVIREEIDHGNILKSRSLTKLSIVRVEPQPNYSQVYPQDGNRVRKAGQSTQPSPKLVTVPRVSENVQRKVSFSKPLVFPQVYQEKEALIVPACWPSRDSIKLVRHKRYPFGRPSKSRQLHEVDSSSTSESTEARCTTDQEESCDDQVDWIQSVIRLQDANHQAAEDAEELNDDDDDELIGEFIDYDAEPDDSDDDNEDDQASLIKIKPRRQIRLAWFARLATSYSRKLVLDGYEKL